MAFANVTQRKRGGEILPFLTYNKGARLLPRPKGRGPRLVNMMNFKGRKQILQTLAENHLCYVLVTCKAPAKNGKIHIEMNYEGDADLASYLLQGAQTMVDGYEEELSELTVCENKILPMNK
jgi:hypothetical protein